MKNLQRYLTSNKEKIMGFLPLPSFEFLMGLALLLCLAWFYYIPGSMPLA
jgi:hypothetical protein